MIALGYSQISPIADVTYSRRTLRKFSENSVTYTMYVTLHTQASLIAQLVKNPLAMQETPQWIPGLGRSAAEGIGYSL